MKYQVRLALPNYFIVLTLIYSFVLPIIRHVSMINEIGPMIDNSFALLAIILFSNTYYIEIQLFTAEVFNLLPEKKIYIEMLKRFSAKGVFLILVASLTYVLYLFGKPYLLDGEIKLELFFIALFAVSTSIIFWGIMSYTIVKLISNLWVGMSVSIIIWFTMNCQISKELPIYMNIFAYGQLDNLGNQIPDWHVSKIVCCLFAILLLFLNRILIKQSPCK